MSSQNPLSNHFRQDKLFVSLPSKEAKIYNEDIITYSNDREEVGIKAMTSADEMLLKNADALLNGEAVTQLLKSCVPAIRKPEEIVQNDIEVLLWAIRLASEGDEYEVTIKCPKCSTNNLVSTRIKEALHSITYLENEQVVNLDSGLTLFLRPHTFKETLKILQISLHETKIMDHLKMEEDEDERLRIISKTMKKMVGLTVDSVADSVYKVINEAEEIEVTNKQHIKEFIADLPNKDIEMIQDKISEIQKVGYQNNYQVTCSNEECKHQWETKLSPNPVETFT